MFDVIIIGGGPAGLTAGIYGKRANLNLLVFEKYIPGGQIVNTAEIENYPGVGKVAGYQLATQLLDHATSLGVEIVYEEVIDVVVEGQVKKVVTNNQTYEAKSVIIAAGTQPRKLGVENEEMLSSNGISWCAICDGPIYKDQRVVVVGGGNSAVEEAYYLSTLAKEVTIVQNLSQLTADQKAIDQLKKAQNVTYYFDAVVTKFIINERNQLSGVEIKQNDTLKVIDTDGVFEYIGLIPMTTAFKGLNITNDYGYILADEKMKTNQSGIFAAGDVNQKQIRQVVTATSDGAVALQNVLKYLEAWE